MCNILKLAVLMSEVFHKALGENPYIGVSDTERYIYLLKGKHVDLGFKAGDIVTPGLITYDAIKKGRVVKKQVSKQDSILGIAYRAISIPLFEDNQVVGAFSFTTMIEKEERLREISREVEQSSSDLLQMANALVLLNEKMLENANITMKARDQIIESMNVVDRANNLIGNIAMQTQILGINASIEAARVGNYGRTFSVVAEEIHKLSDTVKSGANDIKTGLERMVREVGIAGGRTEELLGITQEIASATEELTANADTLLNNTKTMQGIAGDDWL
ncbi:hypothetical protein H1S01_18560 [Heliobacterium chlorum]|uniref:Methyl-accepting transducer domain-containing protein n=1 Tax=Heliobacterium chlorum TaxID=2698 RepID=A0ABR7T8A1_HELCL|nr:methyl-accepting chemotaxis protein [Heliobacterium chlorum]MBC9786462.1 hypothetical protein [Heliobacterium chlorum]